MPSETFFNLSQAKRTKIILAAKKEFTENVLLKSRVSNIIKEAGIPRGSFYQYFEDLEDLYYYVIEELFDSFFSEGNKYSEEIDDLFEFAIYSFGHDYDSYLNDNKHRFVMNVLKSISNNEDYLKGFNDKRIAYIESVLDNMDLSKIKFTNKNDLIKMYQMIQDIKRNVIRKSLIENKTKAEAMKEIKWYIDVLRTGLLKED